ncbi:MAG: MAPEG family protein [Leptolyngbyaceae cyanobacterium bins.302]|nr:MAPEG family protein [Leptolyngbyaceae cyanobacterium bins.302]
MTSVLTLELKRMNLPALPVSTPVVLLYSIAIASALIYLPYTLVAYERLQLGPQAFVTPRAATDKLPGFAQRASWAHQNGFETFTTFATAALMAYVTGVQSPTAAWAAIAFVLARSVYPVFYIANIAAGRALMFAVGSSSTAILFILSLLHITQ